MAKWQWQGAVVAHCDLVSSDWASEKLFYQQNEWNCRGGEEPPSLEAFKAH